MPFLDAWLIFVLLGLVLVALELLVGVQSGYDMVFIGSAFIIGGLVSAPFQSWIVAAVVTSVICIAYVALGRKYVHGWTQVDEAKTNIDTIVGKSGVVVRPIARNLDGLVKVGNEQWRARSDEGIGEGEEVVVTGLSGVTLMVRRDRGGN